MVPKLPEKLPAIDGVLDSASYVKEVVMHQFDDLPPDTRRMAERIEENLERMPPEYQAAFETWIDRRLVDMRDGIEEPIHTEKALEEIKKLAEIYKLGKDPCED
jgi:hypothetical protein